MSRKKISIGLIILIIAVLAVIVTCKSENHFMEQKKKPTLEYTDEMILASCDWFNIIIPKDENRGLHVDVRGFSKGDGYIHVFFPESARKSNLVCYVYDRNNQYLARKVINLDGTSSICGYTIVNDETNLPTMYLEMDSHSDYLSMISKEVHDDICEGSMYISESKDIASSFGKAEEINRMMRTSGAADDLLIRCTLQGRGNLSWDYADRKSFSLRFDKKVNLFGMGENKAYNLVSQQLDPSILKNYVFNEMAKNVNMPYQPNMNFVTVYIDGEYQGIYLLTTKISEGKNRVALKTGDYFYNFNSPHIEHQFINHKQYMFNESPYADVFDTWFTDPAFLPGEEVVYPEEASIEELNEAGELFIDFLESIADYSSDDYLDYIDVENMARYYWIQEASLNFDAFGRSVYIKYDHETGKFIMGPVWDMDLAIGSPFDAFGQMFDTPDGWRIRNGCWYVGLFEHESFRKVVKKVYFEEFRDVMVNSVDNFYALHDALGTDAVMHYDFFGSINRDHLLDYAHDDFHEDYDEYCDAMIQFYKDRVKWIDEEMSKE